MVTLCFFAFSKVSSQPESVFSMDGDCPNLEELVSLCEKHEVYVVVDEAHALGVFGENGQGLVQEFQVQNHIFARIVTFGKGLGCHGAAILGSAELKEYLVNFARSFIYTTGLSPHSVATIFVAYLALVSDNYEVSKLRENINFFNQEKQLLGLKPMFIRSKSTELQNKGFDVKAILSPTVPEGQERLRICLHAYNSKEEISGVLKALALLIF